MIQKLPKTTLTTTIRTMTHRTDKQPKKKRRYWIWTLFLPMKYVIELIPYHHIFRFHLRIAGRPPGLTVKLITICTQMSHWNFHCQSR